jgi:hypothetical protein
MLCRKIEFDEARASIKGFSKYFSFYYITKNRIEAQKQQQKQWEIKRVPLTKKRKTLANCIFLSHKNTPMLFFAITVYEVGVFKMGLLQSSSFPDKPSNLDHHVCFF